MKKLLKILVLIIIVSTTIVSAETIIDSNNVTYNNPKTNNDNVKAALDELIEKVDSINIGGNALPEDITYGKEAYVQGKLVTGTKQNKPVYFKIEDKKTNPYLAGGEVSAQVETTNVDVVKLYYTLNGNTQTITVRTGAADESQSVYNLIQISDDVVGLYWGFSKLVTNTDTTTSTQYFEYLTTYIVQGGVIKKVAQVCTSGGAGDTTNYGAFVSDYSKSTDNSYRSRSVTPIFESFPLSTVDKNNYVFLIGGTYSDYYSDYVNYANDYDNSGYYIKTLVVNKYTGAQSASAAPTIVTSKYYSDSSKQTYDSVYSYDLSPYGLIRYQYDNNAHDNIVKHTYYDYYSGNQIVTSTSNLSDDSDTIRRNFNEVYKSNSLYGMDISLYPNNKELGIKISSAKLGDNANSNSVYLLTNTMRVENQTFDFSNLIPSGATLKSTGFKKYYSTENDKYLITIPVSTGGYIYIIATPSSLEFSKGKGLKLTINSVSYKEKEDGVLESQENMGIVNYTNKVISYYR